MRVRVSRSKASINKHLDIFPASSGRKSAYDGGWERARIPGERGNGKGSGSSMRKILAVVCAR
jgi:hypothetical protein